MQRGVSRPLVIARGGASAEAPSHTIAAFERALGEGADALCLEVRLSLDAHPVVFGSARLEGATDGRGPLGARTVRELKRLDAGRWPDAGFGGQRIQTLQEVLERFRDRTRFWIALPGGGEATDGIEERVVSTVEIYDSVERCVIQSPDRTALLRVRALNAGIRLSRLWDGRVLTEALPEAGEADALCAPAEWLQAADVEAMRAAGLECYAATVDEPDLADRLIGWGVNGIFTGRPGLIRSRIGRS